MKVAVVGLGYVGVPVAAALADVGVRVVGVDIDPAKVAAINAGRSPLAGREPELGGLVTKHGGKRLTATTDYAACGTADAVFVAVETPIEPDTKDPDYKALRAVLRSLGPNLKRGALVSVESTIAPGTMHKLVKPMLERASGMKTPRDFLLAHAPERLTTGKLLHNLVHVDRVVGADDRRSLRKAMALYGKIVKASLHPTDLLTAEIVKTAENTYWDVQLALANELALIAEDYGVDAYEVRKLVNTTPRRDLLFPGAGVGGHCIPKDPWLLLHGLRSFMPSLIPAAREVNDFMPERMATLTEDALRVAGRRLAGARVAVLGFAYKENTDDARNSPAIPLIRILRRRGADVRIHDPFVKRQRGFLVQRKLPDVLKGADAAVLVTAHDAYRKADWRALGRKMRRKTFVDGRRMWDGPPRGWVYRGIGRGQF
ncbi:MAG: nucleotide sugar dehydrogenase [Methanobacteriota archaeon]|nr:MAG: nucleotide sugar dehydrogenase [Euryarchaeota archaeon]